MTSTKLLRTIAATLFIILFLLSSSNASLLDGGPRDIIHARTDVTVVQATQDDLLIIIRDDNNQIVYETTSDALQTVISTETLQSGDYTVETVDDAGVTENFPLIVE